MLQCRAGLRNTQTGLVTFTSTLTYIPFSKVSWLYFLFTNEMGIGKGFRQAVKVVDSLARVSVSYVLIRSNEVVFQVCQQTTQIWIFRIFFFIYWPSFETSFPNKITMCWYLFFFEHGKMYSTPHYYLSCHVIYWTLHSLSF